MRWQYCPLAASRRFSPSCSLFSEHRVCAREGSKGCRGREGARIRPCKYARARARASEKQRYQRRASKTISCVSWVICHPAFFRLQSGRCVLENCKWESAGCVAVGGWGGGWWALGERGGGERENVILLINADTGPV